MGSFEANPNYFIIISGPPTSGKTTLEIKLAEAVIVAYKGGYYGVSRKINITELAERAGFSNSTFDEHLRRAEQKLMRHVMDSLKYRT
jgi:cytidylate kinase